MPLPCREIAPLAAESLGRGATPGARLRLALHLAWCSGCRAYLRGLDRTRALAAASLRGPAPAPLMARLGLAGPEPPRTPASGAGPPRP